MEWREVLLTIAVMIGFSVWTVIGYQAGVRSVKVEEKTEPVKRRVKRQAYSYNAGDLLDPISPRDQRLEQKLAQQHEEEEE